MQYYWLRDRDNQFQFKVCWERVSENDTDYFTKHHVATHILGYKDQLKLTNITTYSN